MGAPEVQPSTAPGCLYPGDVAWLPLLKLVRPAEAYVRQNRETGGRRARRGAVWARMPGWAVFGPPGSKPPSGWEPPGRLPAERVRKGPSRWNERTREVEAAHREAVERGAEELRGSGATVIPTSHGPLQVRLVRFWNGTGVLDCQLVSTERMKGRSFTALDRRDFKENPPARLSAHLLSSILSGDRNTRPDLWGPPPPEPRRIPSPGGWTAPSGMRPGWNWVPPGGAVPRLALMPRWVRVWYHTPFVDRLAYAWMWSHEGWEVVPPLEQSG